MTQQLPSTPGLPGAVDSLLDERFGIINSVIESPHERGEPAFFQFVAETAPVDKWLPRTPFAYGGGSSTRRDVAAAKAIGECIERYCSAVYDINSLPYVSAQEAPFRCVEPAKYSLFSSRQYEERRLPFRPFADTTPIRWVGGSVVGDERPVYVPAASVYLPYYGECRDEALVIPPVSTGLAAGADFIRASLSGLLEVIERDAFCRCWYHMSSVPHVARDSLGADLEDLVSRFEGCGYTVDLLDITSDLGVPVILATARGDRFDAPAVCVAAAAALSVNVAIRKSLEELAMTLRYQRELLLGRRMDFGLAGDWHLAFWNVRERRRDAAFLWASDEMLDARALETEAASLVPERGLEWLVARLAAKGFDAILCDITTADVRSVGLAVVRAVVPGLQPLLFGDGMVAEGGTRLDEVRNSLPHPFP